MKLRLRKLVNTSWNFKQTGIISFIYSYLCFPNCVILVCYLFLNSAAVESTGQAKAEAQSRAEASKIEGEANVEQAKLKAMASKIEAVSLHQSD